MRGASSFDGKMHGNRQMVDRYDESKGKKPAPAGKKGPQRPSGAGGESGGEHEMSGHDEIKQVVMEHGPAHHHGISKAEHGGDGYHSETHHEDGHVHHADHDTLEEAHEHGAHAMDDAEHLGDMDRDDSQVAEEEGALESRPNRGGSNVGFMK